MKTVVALTTILLLILTLHKVGVTFSSVPPTGKTGALGEETCFTSGCHLLGTLNPPNAGIEIMFDSGTNVYIPDSVYGVTVTVTDSAQKIFGFEMTAITSDTQKIGDFIILDSSNTYISTANSKQYISHFLASDPGNAGAGFFTWQFKWRAPSVSSGPFTFYTAGVAAANPVSAPVGNVHTSSLVIFEDTTIAPDTTAIDQIGSGENYLKVFPNPADQLIRLEFKDGRSSLKHISLFSMAGQRTYHFSGGHLARNEIDVSKVPAGLYLIQINEYTYKKIIITH
ncbi:MAG: hypothetical protein COB85_01655 [Bacteroidetes bacterium]|nr:MAG: hypothetical protein COB85_01655 [Bacteroidota bacterium]